MDSTLPWVMAVTAALALVAAVFALWQSLRTALGGGAAAGMARGPELTSEKRATLIERKNAMLRNLRDLEFERQVGKISEADFAKLDAIYRQKAREVLAELDAEVGPWREEAEKLVKSAVAKVKKEAEPAAKKEEQPARPEPKPDDGPSPFRTASPRCPKCEVFNDPDAVFCKKCATRLVEEGSEKEKPAPADAKAEPEVEAKVEAKDEPKVEAKDEPKADEEKPA